MLTGDGKTARLAVSDSDDARGRGKMRDTVIRPYLRRDEICLENARKLRRNCRGCRRFVVLKRDGFVEGGPVLVLLRPAPWEKGVMRWYFDIWNSA